MCNHRGEYTCVVSDYVILYNSKKKEVMFSSIYRTMGLFSATVAEHPHTFIAMIKVRLTVTFYNLC